MIDKAFKDLETINADAFGKVLKGLGLNLIVSDIALHVDFLTEIFDMQAYQATGDFAILTYKDHIFQLHADHTYHSHPLLGLLPENPPRGAGAEIRLYGSDPDICYERAIERGDNILQIPMDKPHGLRECAILSHDGYVWIPSRPLAD